MRSTRYALTLSAGYTLVAAVYIVVSSHIAARMSVSVEQMKQIETVKGVLYVVVTAIVVFFGARYAFDRLERAYDELTARDRALLVSERRVFAGLMAGSIAHDANNVLVGVLADLDDLRRALPEHDPAVHRLRLSVDRLVALNSRLLIAARRGGGERAEEMDLVQGIRETLSVARALDPVRRCRVEFTPAGRVMLHTHPVLVQQIVSNLVLNAAEATEGRGRIEVRLEGVSRGVRIEVHDDGPGVPRSRRERLFEALESTKPGGSGLGLFSVRACARALGSDVEVDDSPLGGACFRVRIAEVAEADREPLVPAGPPPAPDALHTAAGAPPPAGGGPTARPPRG